MQTVSHQDLVALLRWRPRGGVLSVYLDLEPGDRGEPWRIELRNGLRAAVEAAREHADRETRLAVERAAKQIEEREAESARPEGRARIGFAEVDDGGAERWFSLSVPCGPTTVAHASRPLLRPLLAALDQGAPRGILTASSEQVRLLAWSLGETEEIDAWGLEIGSRDWRERRSRASTDPARAQGVSASGRDQHDQRLEANRERFLREAGKLAAERAAGRGWTEVAVFGEEPHYRLIADGFANDSLPLRHVDSHNVVSQPTHAIAERLEALLPEIARERQRALVRRAQGEVHGGTTGALGLEETVQALLEGRVEHLLLDPERRYELPAESPLVDGADPEIPLSERMVELALETSAAVTLVEGDAAELLAEQGGAAAVLRY